MQSRVGVGVGAFVSSLEWRGWQPWVSRKLRSYQVSHTLTSPTCSHHLGQHHPWGMGALVVSEEPSSLCHFRNSGAMGTKNDIALRGLKVMQQARQGSWILLSCFNLHHGSLSTSPPGQCPSTSWNLVCPKPKFFSIPNLALFLSVSFLSLPGS